MPTRKKMQNHPWASQGAFAILVAMANMTRDDVLKLAKLARLSLTDDELNEYAKEFTEILQYVEQLQAIDVSGLEPTNQVTGLTNVTRADKEIDYGYEAKQLLENVPAVEDHQIKVKRMIA